MKSIIYKNAKYICAEKELNLGDVERSIGLATGYLSRCNCSISLNNGLKLAEALGVSVYELIDPLLFKRKEIEGIKNQIEHLEQVLADAEKDLAGIEGNEHE